MKNPISNTVSIAFLKISQIEFDIFNVQSEPSEVMEVRLVDGMWTTDDFRYSQ